MGSNTLGIQRSVGRKSIPSERGTLGFSGARWETTRPAAQLIFLSPQSRPRDRWLALDKAKHLGGSFLVVLGGQYVFEAKAGLRRDPAPALSLGTGAVMSVGKELYDWKHGPTRYFSVKDLAADAMGLLLAAGVILL